MRPHPCAAAILATALLVPSAAVAQEQPSKSRFTVGKMLDWERVSDPQIAPDGARAAS